MDRQLRDLIPEGSRRQQESALDRAREQRDGQSRDSGFRMDQEEKKKPFSPLERDYSERADTELRQFGYDFFTPAEDQADSVISGSVPDDYVLGVGDELVVTLRGQVNRTEVVPVDREGRVVLEDLSPVAAAGRPLGDVREDLRALAASSFLRTDVFVSIGGVRSLRIVVGGEVTRPGQKTLTSFASVVDALIESGGVKKSGTLRNLRIIRGGQVSSLDLYDLLLGGTGDIDIRLRDGDHIIVPPVGPTAAVAGDVVRPAIFELAADGSRPSLDRLVEMAGGFQRSRGNRLNLLRLDGAGRNDREEVSQLSVPVRPNDLLLVDRPTAAVELEGAFQRPGERAVSAISSLQQLLSTPELLKTDPYLPFAVIQTEDPQTRVRRYVPIDLARAFRGELDVTLQKRDRVIVLSREDIEYLTSADVQAVLRGGPPPSLQIARDEKVLKEEQQLSGFAQPETDREGGLDGRDPEKPWREEPRDAAKRREANSLILPVTGEDGVEFVRTGVACAGLRQLASIVVEGPTDRFAASSRASSLTAVANVRPCPELYDRYPDLLPLLLEYGAALEGEVRFPGIYPTLPGTSTETLLRAAGGLTLEADVSSIDLTLGNGERRTGTDLAVMSTVAMGPGAVLRASPRIRGRESGFVEIRGEVNRPGRLDIRPGERLSEALQRVGGLTPQAYAYGAVFTRERVRVAEAAGNERAARELEASIPVVLANATGEEAASLRAALPVLQSLAASLRDAPTVGRVVVEADPVVLMARPELDFVLEAGDQLVIPKRPSHVTVTGEVLSPGSVMFRSGDAAEEYLRRVGGTTSDAERSAAFVVLPNGEALPLRLGSWTGSDVQIPPGSTIVVPRDPRPFDFLTVTRSVTSLISDLAISAASIAVISR